HQRVAAEAPRDRNLQTPDFPQQDEKREERGRDAGREEDVAQRQQVFAERKEDQREEPRRAEGRGEKGRHRKPLFRRSVFHELAEGRGGDREEGEAERSPRPGDSGVIPGVHEAAQAEGAKYFDQGKEKRRRPDARPGWKQEEEESEKAR